MHVQLHHLMLRKRVITRVQCLWPLKQGRCPCGPGPPPSGFSQNCWASSPSYSLVVFKVLVNRLCRLLWEVLISVLVLLAGEVKLLLRVSCSFLKDLTVRHVLPLLGYDVLPLALAHLLSHLYPLCFWIVHFGGHEGLRLGFFDDLYS